MARHHFKGDIKKYLEKEQSRAIPCPLCGIFNDYVLSRRGFPGMPLRNVICKRCGLIRITPRMSDEEYKKFYESDFFEYLNPYSRPGYVDEIERATDENFKTFTERNLISFVRDYVPRGGRVLDIGAGFGHALYFLKKDKNITFSGLEPDPYSRNIAKEKLGIDLIPDTIEEFFPKNNNKFDLIILDQTFEHLMHPLETLKGLAKRLKPEGVIYIGVPGAINPFIAMDLFFQVAHTFNYTPHTLDLFAKKSDLRIIKIKKPRGYPLEVLMARQESSYIEAPAGERQVGSNWREIVRIYRRKKFLNVFRGGGKKVLRALVGERGTEKIREAIDRLIHYRY